MIESSRVEKDNTTKYVGNLFRLEKLKKERIGAKIKDIKILFRVEKENNTNNDRIIIDVRNLFEHEEEKININQ